MNVVGKFGSLISQGVYSVATPFHPFGGAVDIIVVEQQDGTYRSTPWYVRFGKFQGVLKAVKGAEKIVRISVNGVEAGFHMYLDNSGEAYFIREVVSGKDGETNGIIENSDTSKVIIRDDSKSDNTIDECNDNNVSLRQHENHNPEEVQCSEEYSSLSTEQSESGKANDGRQSYEFQDEQSSHEESVDSSGYRAYHYESLDHVEDVVESQGSDTAVVLVSVDGQILTAPISSAEQNTDYVRLNTPQFHLGPGEGADFNGSNEELETDMGEWAANCLGDVNSSANNGASEGVLPMYNDNNTAGIISEVCTVNEELVIKSQETRNVKNLEDYPGMHHNSNEAASSIKGDEIFKSCLEPSELNAHVGHADLQDRHPPCMELEVRDEQFVVGPEAEGIQTSSGRHDDKEDCNKIVNVEPSLSNSCEGVQPDAGMGFEISLCGSLLHAGMGSGPAAEAFDECRISEEEFKASAALITKNENLIVRYRQRYLPWDKAAPIILGMAAFGLDLPVETKDVIPLEQDETTKPKEDTPEITSIRSGRGWRLWSIPFRRVKTLQHTTSNSSNEEVFVDSESDSLNPHMEPTPASNGSIDSPKKKLLRTNVPTTDQIASLNLKEGQNMIAFNFSTSLLGRQQVDARIYVWKWNARIVISDVDGTITKSDVLGQFMPLVGRDWTQSGVARLFSAIKENGYQLLFLSARAIVQAYLTRSFLLNLKQDGKALPNGPVVISPDGLFPSLYREVIRRAPHEFKIACLEDIKALFPSDYNPFYAGFGNRDTDEFSYRKIGIPKGKIFIINPKGEVAISQSIDVKSYTSLHTLVNDMFPPTSLVEQEDFNAWNYWRVPLPNVEL